MAVLAGINFSATHVPYIKPYGKYRISVISYSILSPSAILFLNRLCHFLRLVFPRTFYLTRVTILDPL
jgi:hypothetical protein